MIEENEVRYTMKEISEASGISRATLDSRRRRLGIQSQNGGYTLAETKQILRRRRPGRAYSQAKANQLRQKLQNDGFTCK